MKSGVSFTNAIFYTLLLYTTVIKKSNGKFVPDPDLEKVDGADRPGLERFFKRGTPDSSNYLPIRYQERTTPRRAMAIFQYGQSPWSSAYADKT